MVFLALLHNPRKQHTAPAKSTQHHHLRAKQFTRFDPYLCKDSQNISREITAEALGTSEGGAKRKEQSALRGNSYFHP